MAMLCCVLQASSLNFHTRLSCLYFPYLHLTFYMGSRIKPELTHLCCRLSAPQRAFLLLMQGFTMLPWLALNSQSSCPPPASGVLGLQAHIITRGSIDEPDMVAHSFRLRAGAGAGAGGRPLSSRSACSRVPGKPGLPWAAA